MYLKKWYIFNIVNSFEFKQSQYDDLLSSLSTDVHTS